MGGGTVIKPDEFTELERHVAAAFAGGRELDLDGGTIRGEILTGLLTGLYRLPRGGLPAVKLRNARISGPFSVEGARVAYVLDLYHCVFQQTPDFRMATLVGLRLRGCRLPGLSGRNMRVTSDLVLEAGFTSDGTVDLTDASVEGTLRLAGAVLRGNAAHALLGARLRVSGSVQAIAMRAYGEVRLRGSNVGGSVHLGGARLMNPGADALEASGIVVAGNLFCNAEGGRFTTDGRLLLDGARIGGNLEFTGARLHSNQGVNDRVLVIPHGLADEAATLVADRVRVEGNLELDNGFTSTGTVRLPNAVVGGYLRLSGAEIGPKEIAEEVDGDVTNRIPVALHADGLQVRGDVEARGTPNGDGKRSRPLHTYGQVRLSNAHIRGSASMSGVVLHGPGIDVLFADRIQVGGTLFLRGIQVKGSIRLQNANIGSTLDCSGAQLTMPRLRPNGTLKPSLDARVTTIGKDLLCSRGFRAVGGVRIRLGEVGKMATFSDSKLGGPDTEIALNMYGLTVHQLRLHMADENTPQGRVILGRLKATSVTDGPGLWAATGGVEVNDFTFQGINAEPEVPVSTRLEWLLKIQPDFAPGPYEQLAAMYRDGGEEELAQQVQLEKQRRRYSELGRAGRVWGFLQRWTVGYGYRPWLAILWLGIFWLGGSLWFLTHPMTRLNTDQLPVWNPWLVSLDLLIPIIDFGQDGRWQFTGASQWISALLVAIGWILASTAAAGAARVLKRA
ncbi:oxidoreductase [Lentzea sp. NBRC 105346]|uniref:hypothetical protein n=1 Tax=Lentzea sp. NBRC 105346 TaxID=3032205 RepID=UPI0024A21543|nr:hypothetical protein [Lentzea sp. NBRC 105346]GLZ33069.1 oxidoreductase [Lentzea sp. NBRC 105346]